MCVCVCVRARACVCVYVYIYKRRRRESMQCMRCRVDTDNTDTHRRRPTCSASSMGLQGLGFVPPSTPLAVASAVGEEGVDERPKFCEEDARLIPREGVGHDLLGDPGGQGASAHSSSRLRLGEIRSRKGVIFDGVAAAPSLHSSASSSRPPDEFATNDWIAAVMNGPRFLRGTYGLAGAGLLSFVSPVAASTSSVRKSLNDDLCDLEGILA